MNSSLIRGKTDRIRKAKIKTLQYNIKFVNKIKTVVGNDTLFMSFDTEAYEKDKTKLTELGWVIFKKNGEIIKQKHGIVKEYYSLRNKDNVPDNKDNCIFSSDHQSLDEIEKEFVNDLKTVSLLFMTGYDFQYFNPNGKGIIEIRDVYTAFFLDSPHGLEDGLKRCNINYRCLHNAGNDAYYTMKYFLYFLDNFDISERKYQNILNYPIPSDIVAFDYRNLENNARFRRLYNYDNW
ncbi:hypothetical protein BCR36DRAFT_368972 [Piromyces finnis]|uniref:Gfd2/YDR514C-like C-terminal domain-containing protein n=1 Tax=Piromyces finnis TaxID=1754191 RepID=A0A1Y1VD26_9FUNG|nr:hypothetical protein BCR36DRAFT_368972 [Piromyces finnis]|eukprot:ORX53309.1 hypothetical protein BCR36DRAFT_368972 [Piromyces finnis]